jgi:ribonuclease VapC
MIVDSSALVAILLNKPEAQVLRAVLARAIRVGLSAATYLESSIVMARRHGHAGVARVDRLIAEFGMAVESVTMEQALTARDAFLRFGKGRHPASLNFGDCFRYALARERDEPLLFVGGDFTRTDVRAAVG